MVVVLLQAPIFQGSSRFSQGQQFRVGRGVVPGFDTIVLGCQYFVLLVGGSDNAVVVVACVGRVAHDEGPHGHFPPLRGPLSLFQGQSHKVLVHDGAGCWQWKLMLLVLLRCGPWKTSLLSSLWGVPKRAPTKRNQIAAILPTPRPRGVALSTS